MYHDDIYDIDDLSNTKQKAIPVLLHRVVAEFPRKWLVEFWKHVLVLAGKHGAMLGRLGANLEPTWVNLELT